MPCTIALNKLSLGEEKRDTLEHEDIVDGNDIDIVDPLFLELFVGAYVARDLCTACSCERARYADLVRG